jgi:hypothetical protein
MQLVGDPEGIASLRAMHQKNKGFMRAILEDVRSTTDQTTTFRDEQGRKFKLTLDSKAGTLHIEPDGAVKPAG